jgi:aminoglycoside phosphotransferase (APT) family kinase protein
MCNISGDLLPQGSITDAHLDSIIDRMADLHRIDAPEGVPWCDLRRRLTLLTPETARIAAEYGAPVAADITDGWLLFELHATAEVVRLVHQLFTDPVPLLQALALMPSAFLHGDLKLDNIGLDAEGRLWLIDWAMTLAAPAAVELGWFLAINSRRLPVSLDEVMARYADAMAMPVEQRARHDALTVLCGLLLRGWRKALDAEAGEPVELQWWCERAGDAVRVLEMQ